MSFLNDESEIETVLRGLSEIQPPSHLGQDISKELSASLGKKRTARLWNRPWSFLWQPATLGAVCTVLIALGLTSYLARPRSRSPEYLPRQSKIQQPDRPMPRSTPARPTSSAHISTAPHLQKSTPDQRKRTAFAQAVAMSHPAPVAPLTEQERLLIRIAQGGNPVQLASLNTELQSALATARRNEFIKLSNGGS